MSIFPVGIEATATLQAIGHSPAIIERDADVVALDAAGSFCRMLGSALSEIKGQRHRMLAAHARLSMRVAQRGARNVRQGLEVCGKTFEPPSRPVRSMEPI